MELEDTAVVRDGRLLVLAYDHGMEHGPQDLKEGFKDPGPVFELASREEVTGFAVQKGLAEKYYPSYGDVNLVLKLNGKTAMYDGEPYSAKNCSVERAVELGADAIGYTVYAGSIHEGRMFQDFREVQEEAREHDLPVMLWSYPRGGNVEDETSPETVQYAARLALELGADIAKVKYPGSVEAAKETVEMAGEVKVSLSGGAKSGGQEFLETVENVMEAGFSGLAVGRNVWQREDARDYLKAVGEVVHEDVPAAEAIGNVEG